MGGRSAQNIVDIVRGLRRVRVKVRLITTSDLDGRTRASRRARDLTAHFTEQIGGTSSKNQRLAIERAAVMCALAEDRQLTALCLTQSPGLTCD